jgi:hypothetical protein
VEQLLQQHGHEERIALALAIDDATEFWRKFGADLGKHLLDGCVGEPREPQMMALLTPCDELLIKRVVRGHFGAAISADYTDGAFSEAMAEVIEQVKQRGRSPLEVVEPEHQGFGQAGRSCQSAEKLCNSFKEAPLGLVWV